MSRKILISFLIPCILLSLISLLPVHAVNPPSSGQQLWWKFTENSGTTVADSGGAGNGYTGTLTNSPTWVTGKVSGDYAVQFTGGTHEFVTTVLAPSALSITGNQVSICADMQTTHHPSDHEVIVEMGENEAGSYGLFFESDGAILWQTSAGGVHGAIVNLWNGNWHVICGIYDGTLGSNQMTLWEDGVLDGNTGTATDNLGGNSHYFTAGGFHTGTNYQLGGIVNVAEVMMYDRALSAGEVQQIYGYGVQATTTSISTTTTTTTNLSTTTSVRSTTSTTTSTSTSVHTSTSSVTSFVTSTTSLTTTQPPPITITTNSTLVSYLIYGNGVNITVSGQSGVGYTHVVIAKSFMTGNPIVYLDNAHANFLPPTTITSNSTDWIFDLYYKHSQHLISIEPIVSVPEFQNLTPLLSLLLLIPLAVLRRKIVKSP